jgi:hypothetical protein
MVTLAAGETDDAACKVTGFMGRAVYSLGQGHRHVWHEVTRVMTKDAASKATGAKGLHRPHTRPLKLQVR